MNIKDLKQKVTASSAFKNRGTRLVLLVIIGAAVLAVAGVLVMTSLAKRMEAEPIDAGLLVASLEAQKKALANQQEQLQKEQQELKQEQGEYARLLNELLQLEDNLEEIILANQQQEEELAARAAELEELKKKKAVKEDTLALTNIRKMTKIYNSMRPAALASIIKQLREDLALQILLRMEERRVARLFAALEPAYAARLSDKLNKIKKTGE